MQDFSNYLMCLWNRACVLIYCLVYISSKSLAITEYLNLDRKFKKVLQIIIFCITYIFLRFKIKQQSMLRKILYNFQEYVVHHTDLFSLFENHS